VNKDEIIAQQAMEIAEFKLMVSAALSRIAELEARLNLSCCNSSKPPSSDGLKKSLAFPRKQGGKRGGQYGHKGKALEMVAPAATDLLVVHPITEQQCTCGQSFRSASASVSVERRQAFDLPQKLLEVYEHRLEVKHRICCGKQHTRRFPSGVSAPVQYGSRVHTLVSILNVEQNMPLGRIGELFSSLTGYVNENNISTSMQRMYERLSKGEAAIKAQALSSPVTYADESGARVCGKLYWAHNFASELFNYLFNYK
jgi:transposase